MCNVKPQFFCIVFLLFSFVSVSAQDNATGSICENFQVLFSTPDANSSATPANPVFTGLGQSFVGPDGINEIDAIEVEFNRLTSGTYTLDLYDGIGIGTPGTPIASSSITIDRDTFSSEIKTYFQFDAPVNLTPGNNYHWIFRPVFGSVTVSVSINTGDPYPDGGYIDEANNVMSQFRSWDIEFSLLSCAVEPIPTLGQWGVICLGLSLLILAIVKIKDKSHGLYNLYHQT